MLLLVVNMDVNGELNTDVNTSEVDTVDEPDEFFFESDHLALKGNKDYLSLLKTLAILQAQRARALQDLDTIQQVKQRALHDPDAFISILRSGGDLGVPHRQVVAEVPHIEWAEYSTVLPSGLTRPATRKTGSLNASAAVTPKDKEHDKDGKVTVRGRTFDQSKPETFNQLWTAEEQRRLEELLIEFPPEEIESRRYKKIAEALGNRTRMQVSSRVQKYFLKLMKAGLPVPGRLPKQNPDLLKKGSSHSRQRANHFFSRPSTFFPQHQDLPVYMPEGEDMEDMLVNAEMLGPVKVEPGHDIPTDEQRKFNLVQKVRREKEKTEYEHEVHPSFKCDICEEEPISGPRWHCYDCPANLSVDFCSDCVVTQLDSTTPHPLNHHLEAVHAIPTTASNAPSLDPDYLPQSFSKTYNYLDPNFLPH